MSMLSAQCDELRAMAESVGMAMPQAATLMMEAADTIWELLCRLVDAEVRVRKLGELCKLCEREDENAKLRELVRDMYKAFMHGNCYRWCEFKEPCNYISDGRCQWYDRMRELGVEL